MSFNPLRAASFLHKAPKNVNQSLKKGKENIANHLHRLFHHQQKWAELNKALKAGDWIACEVLIQKDDGVLLNCTNRRYRVLLIAIKKNCPARLLQMILDSEDNAMLADRKRCIAAADLAARSGRYEISQWLRDLHGACHTCTCVVCGKRAGINNRLASLAAVVACGEEQDECIMSFFSPEWAEVRKVLDSPVLHTLNAHRNLRKPLFETMTALRLLENQLNGRKVHFLDAPCGLSFTAAVASLKYGCPATVVDHMPPEQLPHYDHAQLGIYYMQVNMLEQEFIDRLATRVASVGLPAVLVCIHACGILSMVAATAYRRIDLIKAVLIMPCYSGCCLPSKGEVNAVCPQGVPPDLFKVEAEKAKYLWAEHLRSAVGPDTTLSTIKHVYSDQQYVIMGSRSSASEQHSSNEKISKTIYYI